jgi:hypothetical protein
MILIRLELMALVLLALGALLTLERISKSLEKMVVAQFEILRSIGP